MFPALHDYILMAGCVLFSLTTINLAHRVYRHNAVVKAARDAELQFHTLAEAIPQIVRTTG